MLCGSPQVGYGARAYVRAVTADDSVHVLIVKGILNEIHACALIELSAAVIGVKLGPLIIKALDYQFESVAYWIVSATALQCILNPLTEFKVFVVNRFDLIDSVSTTYQCKHVDTKRNLADVASWGLMPDQIEKTVLWIKSPQFLTKSEERPQFDPALVVNDPQLKRKVKVSYMRSDQIEVSMLERLFARYLSGHSCMAVEVGGVLRLKMFKKNSC